MCTKQHIGWITNKPNVVSTEFGQQCCHNMSTNMNSGLHSYLIGPHLVQISLLRLTQIKELAILILQQ